MSIIRAAKTENFTQIDNGIFTDSRLSLKAKGLLCTMLSNSDDWEFFTSQLSRTCQDGEWSVRSAMNELEKIGYLNRERFRVDGRFAGQSFIIYETPHCTFPHEENPPEVTLHAEKPDEANCALTILINNNTNSNNTNFNNKREKFSEKTRESPNPEISEEERLRHLLERISNGR